MTDRKTRNALRSSLVSFLIGIAGGIGLLVAYWADLGTQALGIAAAAAFGGLGYGLVVWAHHLMPSREVVEARHPLESGDIAKAEAADAFDRGTDAIARRRLLGGVFAGGLGTAVVALLSPLRSLGSLGEGPAPVEALRNTAWGSAPMPLVVTESGEPVLVTTLEPGEVTTVYPEFHAPSADAQALLIRLEPDTEVRPPTNPDWVVEGYVAYSKVCTHAGCPVGLYEADSNQLFCPCHQSTFLALEGARPTNGPATRPLPQLPLTVVDDELHALGDFEQSIGPTWWTRPRQEPER